MQVIEGLIGCSTNAAPIRDSILLGCNVVSMGEVAGDVLKALSHFVPSGQRRVA